MKALLRTSTIALFILSLIVLISLVSWIALVPIPRYLTAKSEAKSVGLTPFMKAHPFEIFISQTNLLSNSYVFQHKTEPHTLLFEHENGTNEVRLLLGKEWSLAFTYLCSTNRVNVLSASLTTPNMVCIDTNMDCVWDIRHKLNCFF